MATDHAVLQGHRIAYQTAGSPDLPPLLLIHGYTSARQVWRYLLPELEGRYYCVAIDLLGHGESDKPDVKALYSIPQQAQFCLELLDTLGIAGEFAVIGHSMGGQTALYLAAEAAPQRVTKLVNVAGVVAPRLSEASERVLPERIKMVYRFPLMGHMLRPVMRRLRPVARFYYSSWFYDYDSVPFELWRVDRDMVTQPGMQITLKHGWDAIHECDIRPLLPGIQAQVLSIFGEYDAVVPVEDGHTVQEKLPASRLEIIPECGHFPMYEKREALTGIVLGFL